MTLARSPAAAAPKEEIKAPLARARTKAPGAAPFGAARQVARHRLSMLTVVADRWAGLLFAGLFGLAILIVLARYPIAQSGDGLIQTVFDLQKLTVFYWGADRFANLLPALTIGIADPSANAVCQVVLRVALGLAAPLFVCALVMRDAGAAWRATLVASALLLAFATQVTVHNALIEVTPYGTSFALAGFALLLLRRAARARGRWVRAALRTAALALTCAAYLVNASLVLVAAPLVAGEVLLFGSALAAEFAVASLFAGAVTWAAVKAFGMGNPTASDFGKTTVGLVYYGQQMLGKPGAFLLGMALITAAALLALRFWRRDPRAGAYFGHAAILVAAITVSFLAVALSSWVVLNYMHPRYLVPDYLLAAALGGLSLVQLVRGTVRSRVLRDVAVLGACACLLLVAVKRTAPPAETRGEIVAAAAKPQADAVAAAVLERALDGVAGSYWDVWPAVFQAEQMAHDLGRPPGRVFGVADRGEVMRGAFAARLLEKGRLAIACIGREPGACNATVIQIMTPPDTVPHPEGPPIALPDGRTLTVLVIERPRPAAP